jgi:hypothetical protein
VVSAEVAEQGLAQGRKFLAQLPQARSARTSGSVVPATKASSMARPEAPSRRVATEVSLIPVSSSTLWRRLAWRVRSWMRSFR